LNAKLQTQTPVINIPVLSKSKFIFIVILQKLKRQLEFLAVQEEYIKDEQRNLKNEYLHAQEEVKRIQSVPLVIGQFLEAVDQNTGIVGSTTGMPLEIPQLRRITE
jgi:ATP-dependent 26S proteasome regulatory subunit